MTTNADRARQIVAQADLDGRAMTRQEIDEANEWVLKDRIQTLGDMLSTDIEGASTGTGTGLAGALRAAGFDRRANPAVEVPFKVFQPQAAATFDGSYADAVPAFKTSPPLGADRRHLFAVLRTEGVASDETSVSTFRQQSRTLPNPISTMIRDIAATSEKPQVDTVAELVNEALHQIATVESGVANIMLENAALRNWINEDLAFAYTSAVDAHVVSQILATNPPSGGAGDDLLEEILLAAEAVAAAGYNPSVVAASPEALIGLTLLRQPGTGGDYIFSGNPMPLDGLTRVAVPGLTTAFVLDPAALGTFYTSQVRVASFEENSGKTNTSTVRIESNGVFIVQRNLAIAEAVVGS